MVARIMERWRRKVRERGTLGASWYMIVRIAMLVLVVVAPANQQRRLRGVRELDRVYDDRCNVETGGVVNPNDLGVDSERRRFAVSYVASVPEEFKRTIGLIGLDHREFVFVDLGSGKGRAVLMAMEMPFKKVIGVELSPRLHEVAKRNLESFRGERRCTSVELVCGDAAEWRPPDAPLAVYLYNPFQAQVLREVVANLRQSVARLPRPVYIFYCNPVHEAVLSEDSVLERVAAGDLCVVYRGRVES